MNKSRLPGKTWNLFFAPKLCCLSPHSQSLVFIVSPLFSVVYILCCPSLFCWLLQMYLGLFPGPIHCCTLPALSHPCNWPPLFLMVPVLPSLTSTLGWIILSPTFFPTLLSACNKTLLHSSFPKKHKSRGRGEKRMGGKSGVEKVKIRGEGEQGKRVCGLN